MTDTPEENKPPTITDIELTRLVEAYEKAQAQIMEMAEMMKTAFFVALEPVRDRLESIEKKYDLPVARPKPVDETEEETTND